jgi:hypothetical protein
MLFLFGFQAVKIHDSFQTAKRLVFFFINALLFNNRTRKASDNEEYNGWHLWLFTKSSEIIQLLTG